MITRLSIFLFLILYYTKLCFCNNCYNYTCTNLEDDLCEKKIYNQYEEQYLLKECGHSKFCPFNEFRNATPPQEVKCVSLPKVDLLSYPGGKCEINQDCLGRVCSNKVCIGSDAGQRCSKTSECTFNLACINGICTALMSHGITCSSDEACRRDMGCYKGTCTEYFSLDDGINIKNYTQFYCKSGYALDGTCIRLKNKDTSILNCDTNFPCNYTDSLGKEHNLDTCNCGYNQLKSTNCMLGSENNADFQNYIRHLKEILDSNKLCNAEEDRFKFCREYIKNDWGIKKRAINLQQEEIYAFNAHKLVYSEPCVKKVVFGYDDTPPQPREGKFQCPLFKCNGKMPDKEACAYTENPFDEYGRNVTVYFKDVCSNDEYCNFKPDRVFRNWTSTHYCQKYQYGHIERKKYPGERCTKHEDCDKGIYSDVGFCIDGYCSGRDNNENCSKHSDCLAGHFCNGLRCEKQIGEKGFCIDMFHCQNHLSCNNNTCIPLYSLKNGTYLGDKFRNPLLCENGIIDEVTGQCATLWYKNSTPDKYGFVECKAGDNCYYTTGFYTGSDNTTIKMKCECGYNENGKAYCPLAHNYSNTFLFN